MEKHIGENNDEEDKAPPSSSTSTRAPLSVLSLRVVWVLSEPGAAHTRLLKGI